MELNDYPIDKHTLIYCDSDEDGNISEGFLVGSRVIPEKTYTHYFYVPDKSVIDITTFPEKFKIVDGKLVRKEA